MNMIYRKKVGFQIEDSAKVNEKKCRKVVQVDSS